MMIAPSLLITFDPHTWSITDILPIVDSDMEECKLRKIEEMIHQFLLNENLVEGS
ncbi:MAG: hypothetical protein AB2L22_13625 [Syntrophales bacterium]